MSSIEIVGKSNRMGYEKQQFNYQISSLIFTLLKWLILDKQTKKTMKNVVARRN